jgi:serine/threonine-protein kinase RsbW
MEKIIKIESSVSKIYEVENFLNHIFAECNIDKKLYCNVYLSLNEAVNNAIQHGNKFNTNKFVIITFQLSPQYFEFTIEDEGIGFSFENVKDPTCLDNIHSESGRGIFIMKNYSDKIEFVENGSKIKLKFNKNRD